MSATRPPAQRRSTPVAGETTRPAKKRATRTATAAPPPAAPPPAAETIAPTSAAPSAAAAPEAQPAGKPVPPLDVVVIGGGIVGLATAVALLETTAASLTVLEAEPQVAAHQSGHNSGVIHSGFYYKPGSAKARLCVAGREALYAFCVENGIVHERCGKLVVASRAHELPQLAALERRGRDNGLVGLQQLSPEAMREREPHAAGVGGLLVPDAGIVDFRQVTEALAARVRGLGGRVQVASRVRAVRRTGSELLVETDDGNVRCRNLIACAGLHADRVARLCGVDPGVTIVPFRGEYWDLIPQRRDLVRHLVYPVPDPRFPFLGVHFTRRIGGAVEAGPNAVLAGAREGYRRNQISVRDLGQLVAFSGFWRMGWHHWRHAGTELYRSWSRRAFVAALRNLVPELRESDVRPCGSGVRAMALDRKGRLVDDFHIVESERMIHVLNAPSPAATACLAIGTDIAQRATQRFGLASKS